MASENLSKSIGPSLMWDYQATTETTMAMSDQVNQTTVSTSQKKISLSNLTTLSWNINDSRSKIQGEKSDNKDFVNILAQHDVFCLQETKGDIKIPNFRCYNKLRKGSRSGGLCIGILQFSNRIPEECL